MEQSKEAKEKTGFLGIGKNKDKNLTTKRVRNAGIKSGIKGVFGEAITGLLKSIPLLDWFATTIHDETTGGGIGKIPWVQAIFAVGGVVVWIIAIVMFAKGHLSFDELKEFYQMTK